MKKIFLHNKIIALFVLFLVLAVFITPVRQNITKFLIIISHPFLNLENSKKSQFQKDNWQFLSCEFLKKENDELKLLLSRLPLDKDRKNYILAGVISRPPQSPYDILIIDAGLDNGIEIGMAVTAYGDVLLGYVTEVFSSVSKIKLISFPKEETNVMIESFSGETKNSAIAIGKGGENMEIKLPSAIEIKSGDRIITMGIFPLMVGIVERTEINLSDSFQKILFRLPFNLQELKYVIIKKQ